MVHIHDRGICSSFSVIGNVYPSITDVWAMIGELSLLVYIRHDIIRRHRSMGI